MKLYRNLLIAMFSFALAFSAVVPVSAAGVTPNISVVPCEGPYKIIAQTSFNSSLIYRRLNNFVTPGATLTVYQSYATTISNASTFAVVPELANYGYDVSFVAGTDYGWSKTNNTSQILQLVIILIYDNFSVKVMSEVSPGSCSLVSSKTYKLYKGDRFDLVP